MYWREILKKMSWREQILKGKSLWREKSLKEKVFKKCLEGKFFEKKCFKEKFFLKEKIFKK